MRQQRTQLSTQLTLLRDPAQAEGCTTLDDSQGLLVLRVHRDPDHRVTEELTA